MRCLAADEAWRRRLHTAPARHRTGDGDKPEGKREMHAWYTYLDIDAWTGAGSESASPAPSQVPCALHAFISAKISASAEQAWNVTWGSIPSGMAKAWEITSPNPAWPDSIVFDFPSSSLPTILCNGNTAHCGAYQFPGKTGIYPLPPAAPSEIGHGCFHPAVDAGNHPPLSPGTWSRPQQPTATAPPLLHSATRREPPPPYLASRIIAQRPQAIVASAAPAPDR
ncbi:hypothetical protein S7711_11431 [Stachybotrys chartarum IBT 7711]|uniref:Uncharacterized protein n=1 Tax=Stachybotrys chartarum (strain CBS 109288 / IBT 7711) TaxID=1280523 RepID=A0A084AJY6_STACB|nr:hypothetical protein S7711_11431 [Stachybotrys chartarum IBT 7711]